MKILRAILIAALISMLTACGGRLPSPSAQVVKQAIALEASHAQAALSRQLQTSPATNFTVSQVKVKQAIPLKIQNLLSFRLQGTYDLTLKLAGQQVTQHHNEFDLYLQAQNEGNSWQLVHFQPDGTWTTEPV